MENLSKKKFGMDNPLPEEITLEILSRLPVESVLECRFVCKTWLNLLRDPSFGHMHLLRQLLQLDDHKYYSQSNAAAVKESFIFLIRYVEVNYVECCPKYYDENGEEHSYTNIELRCEKDDNRLYYREYDENDEGSYERLKTINHPPLSEHHGLVGSCNGLICFHVCHKAHNYNVKDPVYICNPITKEYVNLPRFIDIDNENNIIKIVCGFGHQPSIDEYKVVRIYYCRDQLVGHVQVYTLGRVNGSKDSPGMWRNKTETSYLLQSTFRCGVLANGALHWLDMENKVVAFDLAGENFHLLPSPPCFFPGVYNKYELCVFEGWLCVIHIKRDDFIDIWLFKKTKNSSTNCKKEADYRSWSWQREFTLPIKSVLLYEPITFTKDGQILSWFDFYLSRYDPETATMENLLNHNNDPDMKSFGVVRHRNSFVSLKALGEDDVKTIESDGGVIELESTS